MASAVLGTDPDSVRGSALNDFSAAGDTEAVLPEMDTPTDTYIIGEGTCIQVKNRYILTPAKSGVMVVEQHRAHVKVLYERYLALWNKGDIVGQNMLFPELLRISAAQNALLLDMVEELKTIGFDLTPLGDNDWNISGVPSVLNHANPVETLTKILEDAEQGRDGTMESLRTGVALSMARAEAVKGGTPLSPSEREQLLADLFALPAPNYTPDGLLIISIISNDSLAELFS